MVRFDFSFPKKGFFSCPSGSFLKSYRLLFLLKRRSGEIEFEMKAERLANGIPIPEPVVSDFIALGRELAILFPEA